MDLVMQILENGRVVIYGYVMHVPGAIVLYGC
jgi:hypothetical protein